MRFVHVSVHPWTRNLVLLGWVFLACGWLAGRPLLGQKVIEAGEPPLTLERLETLRKTAEESTELDEETRKKVADIYRSAHAELQRAAELRSRAKTAEADAAGAEKRVAQIKQDLERLRNREPAEHLGATLSELEQALSKQELQLTALKKAQAAAEAEPKTRAQRRKEIRERLAALPDQLAELRKQQEAVPAEEHVLLTTARAMELAARRMALEAERPALENELTKYDAEDAADLVRLQRDLCTQEVALAERHLELLKQQIQRGRTAAAEQAVRQARDEVIAADRVLKSYAERNRHLAEAARSVAQKFQEVDQELTTAKADYDQLLRQFEQTRRKVESVGLTSSVGALLRKQQATLPDVRRRRATVSRRRTTIDEAQYQLFEFDDQRQELADPQQPLQRILDEASAQRAQPPDVLEAAARELLERKRDYLDALIRNYNEYFDTLVELDTTEQQIIALSEQYQQYIDERVLWIRSGTFLSSELRFDQSDTWFISGRRWLEVLEQWWEDMVRQPVPYAVAVVLLFVLLVRGRRLRRELRQIGQVAERHTCRHFGPTFRAVVLTLIIASIWPGLLAFAGWRLQLAADESPFVKAVGNGLLSASAFWFPLELLRQVCRAQGLGAAHFNWPASSLHLLRRSLRWLIPICLPFTFVISAFFASDPTHGRDAVERICFILQLAVVAVFLRHVLRPVGGIFQEYIAYHQGGWVDRLKAFWSWWAVAAPMLLIGLTFWGFYYTAQVLWWRLLATLCFVGSLVLLRALLLRLVLLRRRKLSMDQLRERAAAAAEASEAEGAALPAGIVTEQPQADLTAHSEQTRRLLTTGMLATTLVGFWLIWVEVLPALKMLDKRPLWSTASSAPLTEAGPPPARPGLALAAASQPPGEMLLDADETSITFSDVALAILIAVITFMSARNVPGLLEMSVLQRLPLDASVRYAVTSLVSYSIVLLGAIVACSTIGLRWSQIQWLATALTFGLAFGLQEIFANFVAGLIILFERPVRVGDVVTVDEVTGVVSRIRIRATSITNWDRKEYVVPNKEFITGRLLNWTLSDHVNRLVISVGIAYGSDTERARELLLQAADRHPLVLRDPAPIATFEGFGDSALNFTLRAFLPTMDKRLQVIHELHTTIDKAFREAGIEIAFPQRDLHIRSVREVLTASSSEQLGQSRERDSGEPPDSPASQNDAASRKDAA